MSHFISADRIGSSLSTAFPIHSRSADPAVTHLTALLVALMSFGVGAGCLAGHLSTSVLLGFLDVVLTYVALTPLAAVVAWRLPHLGWVIPQALGMSLLGLLGLAFSYVLLGSGRPAVTATLLRFDELLGFDWVTYRRTIFDRPVIESVYNFAYMSFSLQFIAVPIWLRFSGARWEGEMFVCCAVVGMVATSVLGALLPVEEAPSWFGLLNRDERGLTGHDTTDHWFAAREGRLPPLHLADLKGLIAFPSYHTIAALLCAGFACVLGRGAWLLVPLNALMMASAVSSGSHHLVDLLGGAVIGFILLAAAAWRCPRLRSAKA